MIWRIFHKEQPIPIGGQQFLGRRQPGRGRDCSMLSLAQGRGREPAVPAGERVPPNFLQRRGGEKPAVPAGERFRPPFYFLKKRTGRGRSKRKTFCRARTVFLHSTVFSAALRCKSEQPLLLAPRVPLRYALPGWGMESAPQAFAPCAAAVECRRRYPSCYLVDASSTSLAPLRLLSPRNTLRWFSAEPQKRAPSNRQNPASYFPHSVDKTYGLAGRTKKLYPRSAAV